MSILIALWCVTKGLAIAPPAFGWSVGVSTSTNPSLTINSLINLRTLNLVSIVFFASSFTIKSRYLCLNLVSLSFNPCHFSGSVLKDLLKTIKLEIFNESSPFFVFIMLPEVPTMSPTSINSMCSSNFSSKSSLEASNCILPVESFTSINVNFPKDLILSTRPLTATLISVCSPLSRL